ncbi:hypothetical protein CMUS01_04145 [Colletotrichum musicola]|uniref:Uncharacterized protein n=1 Tax=Colletotrichum musicola TaxID=2175873 RepID=A0A8H6U447_9PEZI|nr:hypothetical protein CMUS01_04145 [Colletotrichum musicola]
MIDDAISSENVKTLPQEAARSAPFVPWDFVVPAIVLKPTAGDREGGWIQLRLWSLPEYRLHFHRASAECTIRSEEDLFFL